MKTREDILGEDWLYKSDIEKLLKVSREVARDIFQNAHQHDLDTVGRQRMYYYGRKVSLEAVLAVTGKSFNMLAKQIKSSDSPAK